VAIYCMYHSFPTNLFKFLIKLEISCSSFLKSICLYMLLNNFHTKAATSTRT
jgi:hypothetical protein